MAKQTVVIDGRTFTLEDECDYGDRTYIDTVRNLSAQHRDGLITDREMLEAIILAHVTWCNT